ncbi:hypothetical protein [Pontibacter lucknowensis]|uniref:Uncharacterized protein n=1 Tax=Pontibacter lucknowensis TaxID=1077936 RepID=A0A1N7A560_9BACT|nr:hypothetical protein [Pontibacter lucknowensis]SIR34212.1 hypothetical protein SAMN05421545_3228 [Pontibacter lucknowensis]
MSRKSLSEFEESSGNVQVSYRDFAGDYQFGDCFLYREDGKDYLLLVSGTDQDGAIELIPIAIPSPESISDSSIGTLTINYYSREPKIIDKLLGGEIPSGGFGFYVSADDLPKVHRELEYLFTLNLDPDKFETYGGTSLFADKTLGYAIEFCLDFEDTNKYAPDRIIMAKLPLENLCK